MVLDRDPLTQLTKLRRGELADQLGLTRQHDLHELRGVRLEVREQAHLFEGGGIEVLGLVDDQRRVRVARQLAERKSVVLPVPTSPVSSRKPLLRVMP